MPKCLVLDSDGKPCLKKAAGYISYHGDGEIFDEISWVALPICTHHKNAEFVLRHKGLRPNPDFREKEAA